MRVPDLRRGDLLQAAEQGVAAGVGAGQEDAEPAEHRREERVEHAGLGEGDAERRVHAGVLGDVAQAEHEARSSGSGSSSARTSCGRHAPTCARDMRSRSIETSAARNTGVPGAVSQAKLKTAASRSRSRRPRGPSWTGLPSASNSPGSPPAPGRRLPARASGAGRPARPRCAASAPARRRTTSRCRGRSAPSSPACCRKPGDDQEDRHDDPRRPRQDHAPARQRQFALGHALSPVGSSAATCSWASACVRVGRRGGLGRLTRARPGRRGTSTRPSASRRTSGTGRARPSRRCRRRCRSSARSAAGRRRGRWRRRTGTARTTRRRRPAPARPRASAARYTSS